MRAVFSSLMVVSLLIHAVLGCCWHHAHDMTCCNELPATVATEAGCCHHEHRDAPQKNRSHGPCQGKSTCQGLCTYLPAQKTQLDKLHSHVLMDFAAIVPATCDAQIATLVCMERTHETAAEPPLRLHLFHQILLI